MSNKPMTEIQTLDIMEVEKVDQAGSAIIGKSNLEVIKNVKVKVEVRVGEATLCIGELLSLCEGSVVNLGRDTSSLVDLLVEGKVVAYGKLVAVDDNFGFQVTHVEC